MSDITTPATRTRDPWPPRLLRRFGRVLATGFLILFIVLILSQAGSASALRLTALLAVLAYTAVATVAAWIDVRLGALMLAVAGAGLAAVVLAVAVHSAASAAAFMAAPFLLAAAMLFVSDLLLARREPSELP